jgi:hypothetical protein
MFVDGKGVMLANSQKDNDIKHQTFQNGVEGTNAE